MPAVFRGSSAGSTRLVLLPELCGGGWGWRRVVGPHFMPLDSLKCVCCALVVSEPSVGTQALGGLWLQAPRAPQAEWLSSSFPVNLPLV